MIDTLIKQVQPDIVLLLIFAAALFWTLLWTSKISPFDEFFRGNDKTRDIHLLLGAYLAISYTVYAGYIALIKQTLPDFPWVVALAIFGLLGLVTIKEALAIWRGGPPELPK